MERKDIIFFAILIAAYLLTAFTMNIPAFIHYTFIAIILIVVIISVLLKYQQKLENKKISKICIIIAAIFLVLYIICTIFETVYQKTWIVDSGTLMIPFFGALVVSWFFKNRN